MFCNPMEKHDGSCASLRQMLQLPRMYYLMAELSCDKTKIYFYFENSGKRVKLLTKSTNRSIGFVPYLCATLFTKKKTYF